MNDNYKMAHSLEALLGKPEPQIHDKTCFNCYPYANQENGTKAQHLLARMKELDTEAFQWNSVCSLYHSGFENIRVVNGDPTVGATVEETTFANGPARKITRRVKVNGVLNDEEIMMTDKVIHFTCYTKSVDGNEPAHLEVTCVEQP
jgi:hypothetical protein